MGEPQHRGRDGPERVKKRSPLVLEALEQLRIRLDVELERGGEDTGNKNDNGWPCAIFS